MENRYNIRTKAFLDILEEEGKLRKEIAPLQQQTKLWNQLWNKLDIVLIRKASYEKKVIAARAKEERITVITADTPTSLKNYPVGYIKGFEWRYFERLLTYVANNKLSEEMKSELDSRLYRGRFQFGWRMFNKFGEVMSPEVFAKEVDEFIKEQHETFVLEEQKPETKPIRTELVQMEFDF